MLVVALVTVVIVLLLLIGYWLEDVVQGRVRLTTVALPIFVTVLFLFVTVYSLYALLGGFPWE